MYVGVVDGSGLLETWYQWYVVKTGSQDTRLGDAAWWYIM